MMCFSINSENNGRTVVSESNRSIMDGGDAF